MMDNFCHAGCLTLPRQKVGLPGGTPARAREFFPTQPRGATAPSQPAIATNARLRGARRVTKVHRRERENTVLRNLAVALQILSLSDKGFRGIPLATCGKRLKH